VLEQVQPVGTVYYYHADRLGSVRALTDKAGTVVATYAYDAYGSTTTSTGSIANPFRYAGEYQDAETGLYYLHARYYDPGSSAAGITKGVGHVDPPPLRATDLAR
jgi:uncharacterized protein RhaS with RHS repeats